MNTDDSLVASQNTGKKEYLKCTAPPSCNYNLDEKCWLLIGGINNSPPKAQKMKPTTPSFTNLLISVETVFTRSQEYKRLIT